MIVPAKHEISGSDPTSSVLRKSIYASKRSKGSGSERYAADRNVGCVTLIQCSAAAIARSSLLLKWWKKLPLVSSAASQMSSTRVAAYPLARKTDSAASRSADLDSCCATVIKLPENSDGDTIPTNRYADNHDHLSLDGS